jgi:hypothetical protein
VGGLFSSHLDTSSSTPARGGSALFPGSAERFGEHKGHQDNNAGDGGNGLVSSLPQLMSQTRLVNTRLSQIRNELETVLQSVWAPSDVEPHSSIRSSSLTTNQNSRGGSSVSTATWLTSMAGGSNQHLKSAPLDSDPLVLLISAPPAANVSLTELHDALGVVEKQIVAVQHTRRIVTRAMERPLAEMKAHHQASPDRSSGPTSAVTAGAALRNRVWIAMEFGEQEVQLLLREIQHLQRHLLTVEQRLLALLGVVNHDAKKHDSSDGCATNVAAAVGSSSFATVYRRREGADVGNIRREVESSMRRDPRYALLASTRAALKHPQQRPTASLESAAIFRAAGTAAKTLVEDCGWAPDRVQYRSHYLYELDRLDELIAHEHEKQQHLSDGKKSTASSPGRLRLAAPEGDHLLSTQAGSAEGDALVESTVEDAAADENLQSGSDEKPTADDGAMSAQSYPLGTAAVGCGEIAGADSSMAELADALRRLSPLPSSESAASTSSQNNEVAAQSQQKLDDNPDPLPNAAEPSSDVPNFAESDDAEAEIDEGQSHGRPPTPIRFHERVRDYIRSFLRSGACQWVACQDDTTQATFYFNLDSGEREESLEGYFSDSVAESIAQQLLDEGERTGEGWIFVPGGSTEYGEEDYYCHQRSGEVAWSLVDYVKQH